MRRSYALLWGDARHVMAPGSFTVGRSSTCDMVIDDPRVSRVHAIIRVGIDDAVIQDAGSQNGIRVNDALIDGPVALHDGDRVSIGGVGLTVSSTERGSKRLSRDQTMPGDQLAAVDAALADRESHPELNGLSAREREVIELLAHGHTQREIADQLGLSLKTVEGYRARVSDKLGLRTRAEIVKFALRTGLLR